MSQSDIEKLDTDWVYRARDAQFHPNGNWRIWFVLAGRGFGKTRTGAEWVKQQIEQGKKYIALVGATAGDTRAVMIEGESGILSVYKDDERPEYQPSKRRIIWPNGAQAFLYNAESPERLRGPQHDACWCDELASWQYDVKTWDNLRMTMRLGEDPRYLITTTPKPRALIKKLLKMKGTVITGGSTFDNSANLNSLFLEDLRYEYEGTRTGRQELYAEVLEDIEGALWSQDTISRFRVTEHPELIKIAIGIDPSVTSSESSDETGIVVAGLGTDGHGYVLFDGSLKASPLQWAIKSVNLYYNWDCDEMIGEANNGGDMIEQTIRTAEEKQTGISKIVFKKVIASKGKRTRAEPISSLYERGMVHHVGTFNQLEGQMTGWSPEFDDKSPDRMDALVWVLSRLMLKPKRDFDVA